MVQLLKMGEFIDVAFMKEFEKCTDWFNWISENLIKDAVFDLQKPSSSENYRVAAADALDAVEKGRSRQSDRLRYGVDISNMSSIFHKISYEKDIDF